MQTAAEMKAEAWKYFLSKGLTPAGAAGLMGNLTAESAGFYPDRVEFLCLKRLREAGKIYTDATYTAFVDDGTISREEFLHPLPGRQYGYGLAQWTTPVRKAGLYDLCKSRHVSIANLQAQLDYLMYELRNSYESLLSLLESTSDILAASNAVLTRFEQPADTGYAVRKARYDYSEKIYKEFYKEGEDMTTSEAIQKVIGVAKGEIGYLEKKSNADLDSKTGNAGSGNYTKYWAQTDPSYQGQPWCADFISWCFMEAFGKDMAAKLLGHWPYVYCPTLAAKTTNKTPLVGSIVIFYRGGAYAHTGIVIAVTNQAITTIEGNTSGAAGIVANGGGVWQKSYKLSALSSMTKYYMPDYALAAKEVGAMYYVRSSWLDTGSQTYKGNDLDRAKAAAKKNKQLYVFNENGKILYPVHSTVKARIERAVLWANAVANDRRHGYDNREGYRWGQHGDYACSSFVITAYDQAGVPVKANGAKVTADMYKAFLAAGFEDVTNKVNFQTCAGMVRGDVLLAPGKHTELYIGSRRVIGARGNATSGQAENGKAGDQTGNEIVKGPYYNYPWTYCLRYVGQAKNTRIQAGSFQKKENAERLAAEIKERIGTTMIVTKVDGWYVVRSKAMTKDAAVASQNKLKAAGYDAILC